MFKKILQFTKSKFFWPVLTLILILPITVSLCKPGDYYNMHDDMQLIRQLELEKCLKDGQIPCRWTPDLGYGYGYPLFNFYPPMPYFVGQIFRTATFSFVTTVKLTAISQIVLSTLAMYLLATSIFGPIGGTIASVFYGYAPYHAVNIYVRGAMNEAWAAVFFPLIFYFSKEIISKRKTKDLVFLGLSFAGLMLSHNPMVITFTPYFAVWCIYWLIKEYGIKTTKIFNPIIKLGLSGVLAFSLSAFFSLPVLFEAKLTQIESMFQNYYHFSVHYASLFQLFISNFWSDGPSVWGTNDGMSFMIGYAHWVFPIIILSVFTLFLIKTKKIDKTILLSVILIALGFFTAFMAHEKSTWIWLHLSFIQKIQFPWRFLNHTVFLFSLSVGIIPYITKKLFSSKVSNAIISAIIFIVIIINMSYFKPIHHGPITDAQKFSGQAWTNQITSGIYDYLPKTASTAAKRAANEFVDEIMPTATQYTVISGQKGTDWQIFNLKLESNAKITLSVLAFPNFEIYDNNNKIDYAIEPELGRLVINLDAGTHQIYIKFVNTPIRTIGNTISLLALIFVTGYLTKPLWMKLISKK